METSLELTLAAESETGDPSSADDDGDFLPFREGEAVEGVVVTAALLAGREGEGGVMASRFPEFKPAAAEQLSAPSAAVRFLSDNLGRPRFFRGTAAAGLSVNSSGEEPLAAVTGSLPSASPGSGGRKEAIVLRRRLAEPLRPPLPAGSGRLPTDLRFFYTKNNVDVEHGDPQSTNTHTYTHTLRLCLFLSLSLAHLRLDVTVLRKP